MEMIAGFSLPPLAINFAVVGGLIIPPQPPTAGN